MSETFDAKAHVIHMQTLNQLTIEDDWRSEVEAHIAATKKAADLLLSFPLDDAEEAASVFVP
ncbi:DUF4089 domain-containing protein [uncultured Roseibium sp.]|uniref:DUF4089 domain-containing protein n=1 Tax=uncultured Roseibium sp. TaxID=1936171 RepID=UPI002599948A|nr:DUF4089 domain-containing protein [uncultured Roseibium sp.]